MVADGKMKEGFGCRTVSQSIETKGRERSQSVKQYHLFFLILSLFLMLAGTFSIEQVSVKEGALIITNYDSWGMRNIFDTKIYLHDIVCVETHWRFNDSPKGGTCYDVVVKTTTGSLRFRSFSFFSLEKAERYRKLVDEGIKTGFFFSRRITNSIAVFGSLVFLVLWFLVGCGVLQIGSECN